MERIESVSSRILVALLFLFLCSTSKAFSQEPGGKNKPENNKRLIDFFIIGEKIIETKQPEETKQTSDQNKPPIRIRRNLDDINAFSIIDVMFDKLKDVSHFLENKNYNVIFIAELRRRGEKTWNRISIINKYTMEVTPSSKENKGKNESPNTIAGTLGSKNQTTIGGDSSQNQSVAQQNTPAEPSSLRILPFYVADEVLSGNPYIKEGDYVQVFFFNVNSEPDKSYYLRDLDAARESWRSIASIDSQEMYLVTTGSTPEKYSAKDGDAIRLRFLRAEYPNNPKEDEQGKAHYGDIVSIEDEDFFTYKEYGIKLFISPIVVYASNTGTAFDWGNFNLVAKNPSLGSNIYITYVGKNPLKRILNYLPGIHLSLLALKSSEDTKFTIGFVTSILPVLRGYFGIFYGWYDMKNPVVGITFSPDIKFQPLVKPEKNSVK